MNLSTVGQEDSSSEEISPIVSSSKPTVPPRPRSLLNENNTQPIIVPRRHTAAQKEKFKGRCLTNSKHVFYTTFFLIYILVANRQTLGSELSSKENEVNIRTAQSKYLYLFKYSLKKNSFINNNKNIYIFFIKSICLCINLFRIYSGSIINLVTCGIDRNIITIK